MKNYINFCVLIVLGMISTPLLGQQGKPMTPSLQIPRGLCPDGSQPRLLTTVVEKWDTTWHRTDRVLSSAPGCEPGDPRRPLWARHPHTYDSTTMKLVVVWGCPQEVIETSTTWVESRCEEVRDSQPAAVPVRTGRITLTPSVGRRANVSNRTVTDPVVPKGGETVLSLVAVAYTAKKKSVGIGNPYIQNAFQWALGVDVLLGKYFSTSAECTNCGYLGDKRKKKPGYAVEMFAQLQIRNVQVFGAHHVRKVQPRGFLGVRQTLVSDAGADLTGPSTKSFRIEAGFGALFQTPPKLPIVRGVDLQVSTAYWPLLNVWTAGFDIRVPIGVSKSEAQAVKRAGAWVYNKGLKPAGQWIDRLFKRA